MSESIKPVSILVETAEGTSPLEADLLMPTDAVGVVLVVHGSGSSRLSPRNRFVARMLREVGLATLLVDSETPEERRKDIEEGHPSIPLSEVADRIVRAIRWLQENESTAQLPIGLFASGDGAAAAFKAADSVPHVIRGIVSRGGRLELAHSVLSRVTSPALLIVGARDTGVVRANRDAYLELGSPIKRLEIIPGASHLFDEPGALVAVAAHARSWLAKTLPLMSTETAAFLEEHSPLSEGPGFIIQFSETLTSEQVKGTLEALADYYRAVGGAGFHIDFEYSAADRRVSVHV